jgi:hypothetical protein
VITAAASLADLASHGENELQPYLGRPRPPQSALEWLGIAVARLPDLGARARMSDQINPRKVRVAHLHEPLVDALTDAIASAAALGARALDCHIEKHPASPESGNAAADVEAYAALLVDAHRSAPRRAEFLVGGYSSFLGGAIEAAPSPKPSWPRNASGAGTAPTPTHSSASAPPRSTRRWSTRSAGSSRTRGWSPRTPHARAEVRS